MLKEFKVSNFKTLYDDFSISMCKDNITELNYHLIKKKYLPLKVIFGGNAVGKSSIILAMGVLKYIVSHLGLRGEHPIFSNYSIFSNLNDSKEYLEPIKFYIHFNNKYDYEYYLNIQNNKDHSTGIVYEKLIVDNDLIFERNKNELCVNEKKSIIEKYYGNMTQGMIKNINKMYSGSMMKNDNIFVSYLQFAEKICKNFNEWFDKKFIPVPKLDKLTPKFDMENFVDQDRVNFVNDSLNKLIEKSDFGHQEIFYSVAKTDDDKFTLPKLLARYKVGEDFLTVNAEKTESTGTINLIKLYPLIGQALKEGKILVIDELDASLNAVLVIGLINLFINSETNKNGAQLIFTTHNPIYLSNDILRRDEIEFLEKDENTLKTVGHTLSEFNNARKGEAFLKNYLNGKYINVKEIDFSDIV